MLPMAAPRVKVTYPGHVWDTKTRAHFDVVKPKLLYLDSVNSSGIRSLPRVPRLTPVSGRQHNGSTTRSGPLRMTPISPNPKLGVQAGRHS